MTKPGQRPITLPEYKGQDYPPGLTSAILRQAGLKSPAEGSWEPTSMSQRTETYRVHIHDNGDAGLWAEVEELPGCFASGSDMEELEESLVEAISLYLSSDEQPAEVSIEERQQLESVQQQRVVVCT